MNNIVSHLDITQIFCEVDDFCESFEKYWQEQAMLTTMLGERKSRSRMRLSEVMTIVIAFHGSGYKTFKDFYTPTVIPFWRKAFPHLVSYVSSTIFRSHNSYKTTFLADKHTAKS